MADIGYARVSRQGQDLANQQQRLEGEGCRKLFEEVISSRKGDRPQLEACLSYLRPGDRLVVVRLDRLARSTRELLEISERLKAAEVDLVVLDQQIDTSTPAGRVMFTVLAAIAEFERDLIRERTLDGLARARSQGRTGGRPSVIRNGKRELVMRLHAEGMSTRAIAHQLDIGKSTVARFIKENAQQSQPQTD